MAILLTSRKPNNQRIHTSSRGTDIVRVCRMSLFRCICMPSSVVSIALSHIKSYTLFAYVRQQYRIHGGVVVVVWPDVSNDEFKYTYVFPVVNVFVLALTITRHQHSLVVEISIQFFFSNIGMAIYFIQIQQHLCFHLTHAMCVKKNIISIQYNDMFGDFLSLLFFSFHFLNKTKFAPVFRGFFYSFV